MILLAIIFIYLILAVGRILYYSHDAGSCASINSYIKAIESMNDRRKP